MGGSSNDHVWPFGGEGVSKFSKNWPHDLRMTPYNVYCIIGKNSEYIVHIHTISFLNSVCKLYKKQNCWTSLTKKLVKLGSCLLVVITT